MRPLLELVMKPKDSPARITEVDLKNRQVTMVTTINGEERTYFLVPGQMSPTINLIKPGMTGTMTWMTGSSYSLPFFKAD